MATAVSPLRGRAALVVSIGLLAAAAWLVLWLSAATPYGSLHHHHLGHHGPPPASLAAVFLAGWTVMTVAMMLPTSVPVLAILHTIARRRPNRSVLVGLAIAGYLTTWAAFGAIVLAAALVIQAAASPWVERYAAYGAPAGLLLAGAFQFSSLKYRCLDKCRSPFTFVVSHWGGRRPYWDAFRLGAAHGLFCVGCCWALMLLMFAVGAGSLVWMFVLAAVMAVEKNVSWGRRAARPVGVALLAWGAALLWLVRPL